MKRKRILVVDDEPSFTCLLKMNLEEMGDYEVRAESGAERALAAARDFGPDLILLDVAMPRLLGSEVLAQFRADTKLEAVPVVFLSATVERQWVKQSEGMVDGQPFIAKPASVDEIIENIERHTAASPLSAVNSAGAAWGSNP